MSDLASRKGPGGAARRLAGAIVSFSATALLGACVAPSPVPSPPRPTASPPPYGALHCDGRSTCARQCDEGRGESCAAIARAALEGPPPDPTAAAPFAKRACDQDYAPGCTLLAKFHLAGQGVARDFMLGVALLRHACDARDAEACTLYGNLVESGYAKLPPSALDAREAYDRGCERGSPLACAAVDRLTQSYLPIHMPAVRCADPVEGVWLAQVFRKDQSRWYTFELLLRRGAPGSPELEGTIVTRYWLGLAQNVYQPDCIVGGPAGVATMPAKGEIHGARIHFDGASAEVRMTCGADPGYTPDRFDGALGDGLAILTWRDAAKPRLEVPIVFRRGRCLSPKD